MPCRNMRPQQAFSAGQQRVPVAARSRAASRGSQIPAGGSRVRTERCAAHSDAAPSCNATARRAMLAAPLLAWALQAGIAKAAGSNLSIEEVERRLKKNFQEDQYYVSGKLDSTIFADGCVFTDPTVVSRGRESHGKAVASLFSPETARVDLIDCEITGPQTIKITWRLEGIIKQAGIALTMKPYTGSTIYTLDESTGQIVDQKESWDSSAIDVFVSIFWKGFGVPPAPPADELRKRKAA